MLDEDGGVVSEVEGFMCRRAPLEVFLRQESRRPAGALYRLEWSAAPLPKERAARSQGIWVVVAAASPTAAALLSAQLDGSVVVQPGGLGAALQGLPSTTNVVCLWDAGVVESPAVAAERVATEALAVVHALKGRVPGRLVWVTTTAVAPQEHEPVTVVTSTL
jgi:hypothetical protein